MKLVGQWQSQLESCFIIRASDEFANMVDKGNDLYEMLATTSGRYFKMKPNEMFFRQDASEGECNRHEFFIWPTTEGGYYVPGVPSDANRDKKNEKERYDRRRLDMDYYSCMG